MIYNLDKFLEALAGQTRKTKKMKGPRGRFLIIQETCTMVVQSAGNIQDIGNKKEGSLNWDENHVEQGY